MFRSLEILINISLADNSIITGEMIGADDSSSPASATGGTILSFLTTFFSFDFSAGIGFYPTLSRAFMLELHLTGFAGPPLSTLQAQRMF
jgi:hypothetical protein